MPLTTGSLPRTVTIRPMDESMRLRLPHVLNRTPPPKSEGLKTTFAFLESTENEAAVNVLLSGLDAQQARVRDESLRALLHRRSLTGLREIVRRLHTIDDHRKAIISEYRGRLVPALRDAVVSTEPQLCANGCRAIVEFREYDLMPALVNAMEDGANPNASLAAATLLELAQALYEDLTSTRDPRRRRDPRIARKHVTVSLENSVLRFAKHRRAEAVEALLLLSGRDSATLQQILVDPHHAAFVPVVHALGHSKLPGAVRLLLAFLDDPQAPSAALSALARRDDPSFVEALLQRLAPEPSAVARANLRRIDALAWFRPGHRLLDALDDAAQAIAVKAAMATSIPRRELFEVLGHLVHAGNVGGRRAATEALAAFSGAEANALALKAFKDEDPQVQAAALVQLRPRGVPGALPKLIEMLDSPHDHVRQAAQRSLGEFCFERYLGAFDMLDDDVRESTGELVKKVDPATLDKIRAEMQSPAARRRIRGLQAAAAMKLAPALEEVVLELAADSDHLVRLAAVRTLEHCDTALSRMVLREAEFDRSVAVREAAAHSLHRLGHGGPHSEVATPAQEHHDVT